MSWDQQTTRALEQERIAFSTPQSTKETTIVGNKESLTTITDKPRKLSRRESNKFVQNATFDQTSSYAERKGSKSFLRAPNHPGLSIFRVVQVARAWRLLSKKRESKPKEPKIQFENTYHLGPGQGNTFNSGIVKVCIQEILAKQLKDFAYTAQSSKTMCLNIASEIKSEVTKMNFPRYKIVCTIIIMQNKGQGSHISSRCVWDSDIDSLASVSFQNQDIVCVANVHGVYFE